MNCLIQITKWLRFAMFIRSAQAAAHPIPACSYATIGALFFFFFFFFTSCDKEHLNGERFKKPLWNMIFFQNVDIKMKYVSQLSLGGAQAASPSTTSSVATLLYSVGAHLSLWRSYGKAKGSMCPGRMTFENEMTQRKKMFPFWLIFDQKGN